MNTVNLIGRLALDPELKQTTTGKSVTTLRIAVNGRGDHVDFFDVQVWEKQAETCTQHLAKGSEIGVTGRLRHEQWKNEQDETRQRVLVVAEPYGIDFLRRAPSLEPGPDEPPAEATTREEDIAF